MPYNTKQLKQEFKPKQRYWSQGPILQWAIKLWFKSNWLNVKYYKQHEKTHEL